MLWTRSQSSETGKDTLRALLFSLGVLPAQAGDRALNVLLSFQENPDTAMQVRLLGAHCSMVSREGQNIFPQSLSLSPSKASQEEIAQFWGEHGKQSRRKMQTTRCRQHYNVSIVVGCCLQGKAREDASAVHKEATGQNPSASASTQCSAGHTHSMLTVYHFEKRLLSIPVPGNQKG